MFAAFFAFSGHNANAQNADNGDVETGLIGHWTLDDASGSQITDTSSNANHGTWIDNENTDLTEESIRAKIRLGLTLDADDRINIPAIPSYNVGTTGSFSASIWFKTNDPSLTFMDIGSGNQIIQMGMDAGRIRFSSRDSLGNSTNLPYNLPNGPRNDYKWHLAVLVLDRENNSAHVYIDDVQEQIDSDISNMVGNIGAITQFRFNGNSSGAEFDDVRYYNRALSADDVALLYKSFPGQVTCDATHEAVMIFNHNEKVMQYCNGTDWVNVGERQSVVPTTGLVGHWTLDDTNTTALASVGANGTMTNGLNGASDSVSGKIGTAINFGVDTQLIDFGNILNMGTNDLSYSLWINPQTCASSNTGIVSNRNETAGGDGYSLRYNCTTGNLLAVLGGNAASSYVATSPTDIRGAGWQHIAVNYDRDGNMQLFLNGVSNATLSINAENGVNITTSRPLELGGSSDAGTAEFVGDIDDFRIYNRTLTSGEILAIYSAAANNGLGCTAPNGKAGEMDYNLEDGVMQYCDGENWISMGPKSAEAGASAADLSTTAPTSGLIGHWPLNTDASDALGNSNGSLQNGAAIITSNKKFGAGAVELDGTNDHVRVPTTSNINLAGASEMSVSLWVDLDSVSGTVNSLLLWEAVNGGNNSEPYRLNVWDAGGGQYFPSFELANASDTTIRLDAGNLNYNGWHHVAATYDGATMRIYVDGQLANSAPQTGVIKTPNDGALNVDLLIGSGEISTARYTNGTIDDVRLYNRKLEPEEVLALFRASSLVAHWKMDETGSTTTAVDSSGNGYNATMLNGLTGANTTAGKTGSALRIDGTDDRITVPYNAALHPSQITFCAWVKVNTPTGGYPAIAVTQVWPNRGYNFGIDDVAGNVVWSVLDGAANDLSYNTTVTNWHHYCGTADGTTQNLYVDGNLVGTQSAGYIPMTSGILYLASTTNNINTLNGDIDDIRIYNRVLSAQEIGQLYSTTGGSSVSLQDQSCVNIGDTCSDGSFYVGQHPTDGSHLYITSAADSTTAEWSTLAPTVTNADNEYDGRINVQTILNNYNIADFPAFEVCENSTAHGKDDWYLPAIGELDTVYSNLRISPADADPDNPVAPADYCSSGDGDPLGNTGPQAGTFVGTTHQSSTESSNQWSCGIGFGDGRHFGNRGKTATTFHTRCMRRGLTTLGICSSPRGAAGEIIYNDDFNIMQYCNGSEWVALGSDYSGSAVVLSAPAGTGDCTNIGDVCPDGSVYAGMSPDGWIRMFTTPADVTPWLPWDDGDSNRNVDVSGNTSTIDGDGNTAIVVATDADSALSGFQDHQQAVYCNNLVAHGKNDWYLPAIDELQVLYDGHISIGGFQNTSTNDNYSSSNDVSVFNYSAIDFFDGTRKVINKVNPSIGHFRCVRKDAASTPADPCAGTPAVGTSCNNGTIYAGLSPDGNVAMYATPADAPGGASRSWNAGNASAASMPFVTADPCYMGGETGCQTGELNTTAAAAADSDTSNGTFDDHVAAKYCDDLSFGGETDWYLPAQEELEILYNNRSVGDFAGTFASAYPDHTYWSSSEVNNQAVNIYSFDGSGGNNSTKENTWSVRCVRKD